MSGLLAIQHHESIGGVDPFEVMVLVEEVVAFGQFAGLEQTHPGLGQQWLFIDLRVTGLSVWTCPGGQKV
ncbi:MAG: hypothetical protein KDM81_20080 [Verrucomicrobiae bacterium]|nr:hypothetical protein [Verrucomicrobiae bacterium]